MSVCAYPIYSHASIKQFYGNGYNEKGQLLFNEMHTVEEEDHVIKWVKTLVVSPSDKQLVSIESNFKSRPYLPDVTYFRYLDGLTANVRNADDQKVIMQKKEKNWSSYLQRKISFEPDMVAGHGFFYFLIDKAEELLKNHGTMNCQFLLPVYLEKVEFIIEASRDLIHKDDVTLTLKLANPLYRIFASAIEVKIDLKSRWVVSYKGPNTFLGTTQEFQNVKIEYHE